MEVLLDWCRRQIDASRPISIKRTRILQEMPQKVETGYFQWQNDCDFWRAHSWLVLKRPMTVDDAINEQGCIIY
jgi:hypothetical protein